MQVLTKADQLAKHLAGHGCEPGCLADTGFLYAASYMDDRVYNLAVEVFEVLAEFDIPIYANVISRMEFIDLIFRKQVTLGAVQMFHGITPANVNSRLFNLLKNIRDQDVAHKRKNQSYKISDRRLKDLKDELETAAGSEAWTKFCSL
jgi:hypothetical protein